MLMLHCIKHSDSFRKVKQEKRKYASIVVLRDNLQLELGKQRYLKERMREQEERKVDLNYDASENIFML